MKTIIKNSWTTFKKTPIGKTARKISPQWLVNMVEHYPLAVLANILYLFPSRNMIVIGVTGTDGKTTTVNMIYQILKKAGKRVSMISTINAVVGEKVYETGFHVTSPHPFTVQQLIKQAKQAGAQYLVLEVTSNALDQYRFWGIRFDIGVITNITHDHLDYHKTWENYFKAKSKLIQNTKIAILNKDEDHFSRLSKIARGKVVSFGKTKLANFNPQKFPLKLKIPGEFNILNGLAAAAVGINLGIDSKIIKEALQLVTTIPGRMEEVPNKAGIKVVIDFAHTPNGLKNALQTLKRQTKGNLIAVFGAAAERDSVKRPVMGKVAGELADITILTDEDPRFEDSLKIINEIAAGSTEFEEGKNLFKQPDREKAIHMAIKMAGKNDLVGIFGKGHEKTMNYKGTERKWSDKEAVEKYFLPTNYGR